MKIAYLGDDNTFSTSFHRSEALKRLGHEVAVHNPSKAIFPESHNQKVLYFLHYRTGYRFVQMHVLKWLKSLQLEQEGIQLIWVNSGELFGETCLQYLRVFDLPVVLYNNDDPTGKRDGNRFLMVRRALPYYDLCAIRAEKPLEEFYGLGCKKVQQILMSYDEEFHKPFEKTEEIPDRFLSEVVFIGTWIKKERRDEFFVKLIDAGLPLAVWGKRWQKSPLWNRIKPYYKGDALGGKDYVAAIQGAKICLGLLSKGNRDLHTRRSVEIPYAGGLLCAERTSFHKQMYHEDKEAVFWDNADECIKLCKNLLQDNEKREKIRLEGMKRIRSNKIGNEEICSQILNNFD